MMYKCFFLASVSVVLLTDHCFGIQKKDPCGHLYTTEHAIPYISSNAYRSICDHHHDRYSKVKPSQVKTGDLVFVNSDTPAIDSFFTTIHPRIKTLMF